jgi:DNA-binding MarR family transcriptional regulator
LPENRRSPPARFMPTGLPSRTPAPATQADAHAADAVQVLRQFRLVFNAVKTHFQQVEKQAGIGGAQVWALSVIADRPGIGVTDLAREMDIHQSTASNLVRGLLEQELIRADKDVIDRRSVRLTALPSARRLLLKAPGPFSGVLPQAIAELDPTTLRRLRKDLSALLELLHADRRAAHKPLADL